MTNDDILKLARATLDVGLCFDMTARITRSTDAEILAFANALLAKDGGLSGWQPIETAPKEWGSHLVWSERDGIETLWFQLKDGGRDGRKAGNWYSEDADEDDCPKNHRVTHWMPLPAAPQL